MKKLKIKRRTLALLLDGLQEEMAEWQEKNFPGAESWQVLLGVGEEVGEINHAFLKKSQGIRGTAEEHDAAILDGAGDAMIYLINFCTKEGLTLSEVLLDTWDQVKARDWQKNKETGEEQ